ncbi:cupin domain-containing protein [Pseudovibrio exalbescens]|uniref:cupin domain-containing protein n=1 Tax=Pseudovibrio exalbescens TaxID=197461 RepID=UPI0023670F0D|nr:cupin domain-containing protein [Pseudovibrio exalbescens]MDD7909409.1 cupin domain-containing protein [Pseudovibrio exalbescens]
MSPISADDIIRELNMQPHPEGGYYVETFRDGGSPQPRGACTAIYYLLKEGQLSHWHKVDACEIWHFYAGDPLALSISDGEAAPSVLELGTDIFAGQRPQGVVPAGAWQSARALGSWTLVGCTVAPGFQFEGFELAPKGWVPGAK